MNVYVCEICGDAYIGEDKPTDCPFCGAKENFIKSEVEAQPIFLRQEKIGDETKKRMLETYKLETNAVAIYNCMAEKAKEYSQKAMYKRLAKVEMEHATIVTKFLAMSRPEIEKRDCSNDEKKNFQITAELEENATVLYAQFTRLSSEKVAKIFFTALSQVEKNHLDLINQFLR